MALDFDKFYYTCKMHITEKYACTEKYLVLKYVICTLSKLPVRMNMIYQYEKSNKSRVIQEYA